MKTLLLDGDEVIVRLSDDGDGEVTVALFDVGGIHTVVLNPGEQAQMRSWLLGAADAESKRRAQRKAASK